MSVAGYTPSPEEVTLVKRVTRGKLAYLGFLILLKTFKLLGYMVPISQVPRAIFGNRRFHVPTTVMLTSRSASSMTLPLRIIVKSCCLTRK
jgi:hypothetical protein